MGNPMFDTTNDRHSLVELLRPPPGYRLGSAIGTTYSLDFLALTTALLALSDADEPSEADEEESSLDQGKSFIEAIRAIRGLAGKVRIYVHRGRIDSPEKPGKVSILYDGILREMPMETGSFHPKVWVLLFRPESDKNQPKIVRAICSSRNMTKTRTWEAFVSCEGVVGASKVFASLNSGICGFLDRLPDNEMFADIFTALERTRFETSQPFGKGPDFLWQWHGGEPLSRRIPSKGQRALIVSPFVGESFLAEILKRFREIILISTQEALDGIENKTSVEYLRRDNNKVYCIVEPKGEEGPLALDLHAKIMVFEHDEVSVTFLGSANATHSAWEGKNCEAMMRFSPGIPIDKFCKDFVCGDGKCLQPWIEEWTPGSPDEQLEAKRILDEIRNAISDKLNLCAEYETETKSLALTLKNPEEMREAIANWIKECDIRLYPWSPACSKMGNKPLEGVLEGGIRFENIGIANLTEFVAVEIKHRQTELSSQFIIKAVLDLPEWRQLRDAQWTKEYLKGEDFEQLIIATLRLGSWDRPPPAPSLSEVKAAKGGRSIGRLISSLTIEDVLRSCSKDSARVAEIDRLVKQWSDKTLTDEESEGFKQFKEYWNVLAAAFKKVDRRKAAPRG